MSEIKKNKTEVIEEIGIIKEIDNLGRLVIPKEIRSRYLIDNKVELIMYKEGILIRNPTGEFVNKTEVEKL